MDYNKARMLYQYRRDVRVREFSSRRSRLMDEYHSKVTHDFSRYVFIMLRTSTKTLQEGVLLVSSYPGYECHREVRYQEDKTVHLYARFADSVSARQAATQIAADPIYNADILSTILENWYFIEMSENGLPWTLAVLDTVGEAQYTNPLDVSAVNRLLLPFGDPRTFYLNEPQPKFQVVQVLFSSMAEALGATIVLGLWCKGQQPANPHQWYYRMKIIATKKEEALLKSCLSKPDDTLSFLDLDYFMSSNKRETKSKTTSREDLYSNSTSTDSLVHQQVNYQAPVDHSNKAGFHNVPQKHYVREFRSNSWNGRKNGRRNRYLLQNPSSCLIRVPIEQPQQYHMSDPCFVPAQEIHQFNQFS